MLTDRLGFSAFSLVTMVLVSCAGAVEPLEAEPPLDDGWAFTYAERGRDNAPALDLRGLNEKVAGQSGFVRLSPDGNGLVLGDGTPARFWAIGSELYLNPDDEMKRHVKFLARMGVNMVRLHTEIASLKGKVTDVNEQQIDGIWRFVAAAKQEGIYVTISPYWSKTALDTTQWGIEGYTGSSDLCPLLFFEEKLQEGYKAWAAALFARQNPYTGIALANDASVAIIQVQNEDSMLFWTTDSLRPAQRNKLGGKFADWLIKKYGTLEAAQKAWGGASRKDDDFARRRAGLLAIWEVVSPNPNQRASDQIEFYARLQRDFYAEIGRYYREKPQVSSAHQRE